LIKAGQADPPSGIKVVEEYTRANFQFNAARYSVFRKSTGVSPYPIVETTNELFRRMQGTVVPMYFWDSADNFLEKGKGFSMIIDKQPVCTAYSAYIFEGQLELGIETIPQFRGKGFALYTCAALIDYCLMNNYEPIWSCRFENTASCRLAQKLGFEPTVTLPYYKLPV
jgi:RimJ/RimL family protein N-acetyltransferase